MPVQLRSALPRKSMNRRGFFKSLAGLIAVKALAPFAHAFRSAYPIEPGEALFILPKAGTYTYRYVYRNSVTGCCSDALPTPQHTFMMPEHDVMDVYRVRENGEFEWFSTNDKE